MRATDRKTIVDTLTLIEGDMTTLMDLLYRLSASGKFTDEEEDACVRLDMCLEEIKDILEVYDTEQ